MYRMQVTLLTAGLFVWGCDSSTSIFTEDVDAGLSERDAGAPVVARVFALGSDTSSLGILSSIELPSLALRRNIVAGVAASDSIVRAFNNKLYIINRLGADNITLVNPGENNRVVAQISSGVGSNPQDVAVVGNKIYVCALQHSSIIVLDESRPSASPEYIDMASYDADGRPDCSSIVASGGKLYATLGLLDESFTSRGGKIVVIDASTHTIETDFDLAYNNPFGLISVTDTSSRFGGDLLVQTTEDFSAGNGCIERITTGDSPSHAGCLLTNATLGGFASVLRVQEDTLWAAVSANFTTGNLFKISDPGAGPGTTFTPSTQQVTDFVVCPSGHVITNDVMRGALRVYDKNGQELPSSPLDIGLPPVYANGLVCF